MRHVRVGNLWIQEKKENGELGFNKINGLENPGDLMTKYLAEKVISKLMRALNQYFVAGRADTGLVIT